VPQLNEIFPRLVCGLGIVVFVTLAWSISTDRRQFPWRIVIGGLLLQFTLAVLVLQTDLGQKTFKHIGDGFQKLMSTVDAGSGFLFSTGANNPLGDSLLATFAFGVLPTVIFFSSLMSVLYHLGVMQRIVWAMAWVMKFSLKTSGPETLAAAANVFVGHTEAPLVVRPYLSRMSRSELCAMMTGGFATVTGGLLGAYAKMGVDISHLLTASIISAPAALLIAKVMVPNTPEELTAERSNSNQKVADDAMTLIEVGTQRGRDIDRISRPHRTDRFAAWWHLHNLRLGGLQQRSPGHSWRDPGLRVLATCLAARNSHLRMPSGGRTDRSQNSRQ